MDTKVKINQLATGVPGLDEVLGGGLPEFSFNLIAGLPGSGKTTLAHQIMFAMAKPGRRALYFTVLGEPPMKQDDSLSLAAFCHSTRLGLPSDNNRLTLSLMSPTTLHLQRGP